MLNKVILKGNVGRTPKVLLTQEGKEIVSFSLATNVSWKVYPRPLEGEEQGEPEQHSATDWHRITVFHQPTIKYIKGRLKRGDPVYVEGKLAYQHWTDTYGQPRFTPHVVVSGYDGRVESFRPLESKPQDKELITETEQDSVSYVPEDDYPCPSSENSDEDSSTTQHSQDNE